MNIMQELIELRLKEHEEARYKDQPNLGTLIKQLQNCDPDAKVEFESGYFQDFCSWRGAIVVTSESTRVIYVKEVIRMLRGCIGETFTGYKGGEFTIQENTPLYLVDCQSTSGNKLVCGVTENKKSYSVTILTKEYEYDDL